MINQPDQANGHPCLTKQDDSEEDKQAEETKLSMKDVMCEAIQEQDMKNVTSSSNVAELEGCRVRTDNEDNTSEMEEITTLEMIRSQTCFDKPQVSLSSSQQGGDSCPPALEKQLGSTENSEEKSLQRNHETSKEESSNICTTDVAREAAVGLPAKKKRRMGTCGLTEKERGHFLQPQKRENGAKKVKVQICQNNTHVAQEEITSSQFIPSTSTKCDPSCPEEKHCGADTGAKPEPEHTSDPKSHLPTQVQENMVNQQRMEPEGSTTEILTETKEGHSSTNAESDAVIDVYINPAETEEPGMNKNGSDSTALQDAVSVTGDELEEKMANDADCETVPPGTSSTVPQPEWFNCGSVELCEASVIPTAPERNNVCAPDDEPTANIEDNQMRENDDPFGSGCLDYVSDSQLNNIVLIDEEVMECMKTQDSADSCEDATELICGLIRELSSLNQKVMATHRELENLRRGSKMFRSSLR